MDDSFFIYLDHLVLMGFFSGYLLIYLVVRLIADNNRVRSLFKPDIRSSLPRAYALVGILYLGLLLKDLYPDYSVEHVRSVFQEPFPKIWGLLSILFFIPVLNKKPYFSLLHSLFFFFFLIKDIFLFFFNSANQELLKNDMNIYTNSLLLNFTCFVFVVVIRFILYRTRKTKDDLNPL